MRSEEMGGNLIDGKDYFDWHVNKHFGGMLEKIEALDESALLEYLSTFLTEVERLNTEGKLARNEDDVRSMFLQRLRDNILKKMAFQLGGATELDKTAEDHESKSMDDEEYSSNLEEYYSYTNKIHFRHVLDCHFPGNNEYSKYVLTMASDHEFFSQVNDPLWQCHIKDELKGITSAYLNEEERKSFFENLYKDKMPKIFPNRWKYLEQKPDLLETLQKHSLGEKLSDLKNAEEDLTAKTISKARKHIRDREKKSPGTYMTLMYLLRDEELSLKYSDKILDAKDKKHRLEIIEKRKNELGLEAGYELFDPLSDLQFRLEEDIEDVIDNYRLQFYAQELANSEFAIIDRAQRQSQKEWESYYDEVNEIDEDPGNAEFDYDGPVYPEPPSEIPNLQTFHSNPGFIPNGHQDGRPVRYYYDDNGGLTNNKNLINICSGQGQLNWLVHQYAEYEIEVFEDVLELVDFQSHGLDKDIASYILRSSFLDHDFTTEEVLENGFTLIAAKRLVKEISEKAESKNEFGLTNLSQYTEKIQSEFANSKILNEKRFIELRNRFNQAFARNDLIEVQKLWPVFTKLQRLISNTQHMREKAKKYDSYKPGSKGEDYDFGKIKPMNYEELVEKAWESYEEHSSSKYSRLYLSPEVRSIIYSAKKYDKIAKLNFSEIMNELRDVGRLIKSILNDASKGEISKDSSNLFIPTFCFVVTNQPHKKGGDHERIFVPITMDLNRNLKLLSKDYEDGVFTIEDEVQKDAHLREVAKEYIATGKKLMGHKVEQDDDFSKVHYSKIYHSERIFIEALSNPEVVEKIAQSLRFELEKKLGHQLNGGKYKVYSMALLAYSTNSICDYCTPSLVALQNTYEEGFLKLLTGVLNSPESPFKTRGYNVEENNKQIEKFRMLTFINADLPYTNQAHELKASSDELSKITVPNQSKIMRNPKGIIYLPKNVFDIKKPVFNSKGMPEKHQTSFVEFVDTEFSSRDPKFNYCGSVFMSGSKKQKFSDVQKGVNDVELLNKNVYKLISERGAHKSSAPEL